jgi:hypothetical protein
LNLADPVLGADVDEVVAAGSAGSLRAYWLSVPPLTVSGSAPLGDHPGHHVCFGRVGVTKSGSSAGIQPPGRRAEMIEATAGRRHRLAAGMAWAATR